MGLLWVRRKQQRLTKSVLAVFCLAWLQMAALPCTSIHAAIPADESVATLSHGHGSAHMTEDHVGHANAGEAAHHAGTPCHYCPTPADGDACEDAGACAFPHGPQADLRAAAAMACLLPALVPLAVVGPSRGIEMFARLDRPSPIPRRSLTLSYCRFIE
jgi:hypothetical protein